MVLLSPVTSYPVSKTSTVGNTSDTSIGQRLGAENEDMKDERRTSTMPYWFVAGLMRMLCREGH